MEIVRKEKIIDGESQKREKMQVRERQESRETQCFFQCFVALEGRKVGSLKRRVQGQLAR